MGNLTFFVAWELWQQMTFVLAMSIVIVFCAGLIKLWWMGRWMKKHQLLDEEKRARFEVMRKSGVAINKRPCDIPFGVRAIQSGVQVDGIWISRPGTPAAEPDSPSGSSATLGSDPESKGKKKAATNEGNSLNIISTRVEASQLHIHGPPANILAEDTVRETTWGAVHAAKQSSNHVLGHPSTYRPRQAPYRAGHNSTEKEPHAETLGEPENIAYPPTAEAYIPSSGFTMIRNSESSRYKYSSHRTSGSSETASGTESYNQPQGYYLPTSRIQHLPGSPTTGSSNRIANTAYSVQTMGYALDQRGSDPQDQRPLPSRGPSSTGDFHANKSARRVNPGFEVLPAGTFGTPPELQAEDDMDYQVEADQPSRANRISRLTTTKLRKSSKN